MPKNQRTTAAGAGRPLSVQQATQLADQLFKDGMLREANSLYLQLAAADPKNPHVLNQLGTIAAQVGNLPVALQIFSDLLKLRPDAAIAHNNLGNIHHGMGQCELAMASYRRALALNPDYADAHGNLAGALVETGQFDASIASYRRALELDPDNIDMRGNLLFALNYLSRDSSVDLLAEARRFGELAARRARPFTSWPNTPDAARRLRVGLVSGDLRNHPVGYFLDGVLAALKADAADRLHLIAYAGHARDDFLSERLKACCHGWCATLGMSDAALAQRIRDDGIDILIDLSGHTELDRLAMFAWKPAPVQATWLGYFATTGVAAIDYLIADPHTLPASEEVHFTEKIWRLPETRLCFTPPNEQVEIGPLPARSNGHITFGSFGNLAKLNDAVLALWSQVLHAVPGSRLFLMARQLAEAATRAALTDRFAAHGIGAERLVMEGLAPRAAYLEAYRRVDIVLDTFPYPGGTTTAEALWMGVPVLTLAGQSFLSRQGVGMLMNAGLPEWIAADGADFVTRAVAHAAQVQALAELRAGLRQQVLGSPLFDAPRFARHLEAALRGMWTAWCGAQSAQAT